MSEFLSCAICCECFTSPVFFPCGHGFCKECIEQWETIKKQCPTCKGTRTEKIKIPCIDEAVEEIDSYKRREGQKIMNLKRELEETKSKLKEMIRDCGYLKDDKVLAESALSIRDNEISQLKQDNLRLQMSLKRKRQRLLEYQAAVDGFKKTINNLEKKHKSESDSDYETDSSVD